MATLKEVQLRIQGVRNTQKITKAMKIVAATKLKKHERTKRQAEVFSATMRELLENIVKYSYHPRHPLLREREEVSMGGILVIGSDRGLCGAFNSNLFRKTVEFIEETHCQGVKLVTLGKRTYNFFKKQPYKILFSETPIEKRPLREFSWEIAERIISSYLDGTVHKWCIISNRFVNRVNFGFSHDVLLPVMIAKEAPRAESLYLFEDNISELLGYIVPRYIADVIYRAIVESQNVEEMARMMAMDYATENAEELIGNLTLFYNRTRQQVITKEISEIVGGAEALK